MREDYGRAPILLFVTDLHFSGQRPRWRVGNYFQDLLAKLHDIRKIVKDRGIPRVVIGGDVTHSATVSLELGDLIVDAIEGWGVPTYVVPGNHDVFANSYDTMHRSWLGHIFRRSGIEQLDTIYDGNVCIWGVPYDDGIEERLADLKHSTESSAKMFEDQQLLDTAGNPVGEPEYKRIATKLIEVVHAMVVPGGMHPDARQIDPKDYKTRANLVLSGDYHPGWPDVHERMDLTKFVNPGAMARRSSSESDCMRMPRVALVNREMDVEFVGLPSAKPPEEAFDLEGAGQAKEWERNLDEYVDTLMSTATEKVDIRQRIETLAQEDTIDRKVKLEALDRYDRFAQPDEQAQGGQ